MIFRIVFGFSGMGQGWAETHAFLNAAPNPKDHLPTMLDIANKRAQMLGREFSIIAIRIARYATDAGVRARGAFLKRTDIRNSVGTVAAAAEPAQVAYIVRGSAEPSILNPAFDANQNQTFLGAPLDDTVNNAGVVDTGRSGLLASFLSWRSAMLSTTMGWLASDTIANMPIDAITQNLNGTVKITTVDAFPAGIVIGQSYKARARQINEGVSPLNGELILRATAAKEFTTREVIGLGLAQAGGFVRVYRQVQPFVDYGDLDLNAVVGKHKRGRPFGSTPGRARRRVRG